MFPLLDGRTLEQKIEDAKKLLQENGYSVKGPLICSSEVKTPAQLVRFFYDTMARYNPQFKMVYSGNTKKDHSIAKRMIEGRIEAGSTMDRALSECCMLVETLFKYEEHVGLNFKVTSMGVFGLDSMAWVTERLWEIYEGVNRQVSRHEEQKWWDELYKKQEITYNESGLTEARKKMDRILKRYAEEKEGNSNGSR